MDTKNLWIASLTGAVLTTLVSNLPVVGLVNCLLCIGFWGSALLSVWLYRRLNGSLTLRQGLSIGLLTGLCAGVLGFLLGLVGLAGVDGLLNTVRPFLPPEDIQEMEALPAWLGILVNLVGVLVNVVFGAVGGYLGGALFRTDRTPALA